MQKIEKLEEFGRTVKRIDPDLGQHVIGGLLAVVTALGVMAMVAVGMTSNVPLPLPIL